MSWKPFEHISEGVYQTLQSKERLTFQIGILLNGLPLSEDIIDDSPELIARIRLVKDRETTSRTFP